MPSFQPNLSALKHIIIQQLFVLFCFPNRVLVVKHIIINALTSCFVSPYRSFHHQSPIIRQQSPKSSPSTPVAQSVPLTLPPTAAARIMVDRPHRPTPLSAKSTGPQPAVNTNVDNSKVSASLPTGEAVEVLLHGATVISWKSGGRENLWLSEKAVLDGSKPVRGGFPVVFPVSQPVYNLHFIAYNVGQVFGPPPKTHATSSLPQHGFARNSKWQYLGKSSSESGPLRQGGDDSVKLDFGLGSTDISDESQKAWPYEFSLVYSVTLSRDGLQTTLQVTNTGDKPFEFQMLLHSYFKVKVNLSMLTLQLEC